MTEKETLTEQDLEKSDSSIHDLEGICWLKIYKYSHETSTNKKLCMYIVYLWLYLNYREKLSSI